MPTEYFRAIIDSLGDPVFVKDREHRFVFANSAACEAFGKTLDDLIGRTDYDLSSEKQADIFWEHDILVLETGEKDVNEETITDTQGAMRTVVTTKTRYVDEAGERYVVGSIRDITERKAGEEKLLRLNRELRAISDCNQVLVRAADEQILLEEICRIICEEAGYRMAWVGYGEKDDAKTVRPAACFGMEKLYLSGIDVTWADTEHGHGPTGTAIRTGEIVYVGDIRVDPRMALWTEKASSYGYRSSVALPLRDEKARAFGALNIYSGEVNAFTPEEIRLLEELAGDLAFGITVLRMRAERTRAEEALRTSRLQLAEAADMAKIAYWEHDEATGEFIFNDAFYELYATTAQREGGYRMAREEYARRFVHPDDRDVLGKRIEENRLRPQAENLEQYEHRVIRRDGEVIYVLTRNRVIMDPQGRVLKAAGVNQDITARKKMEAALRESEAKFRSYIERSPLSIVVMDERGAVVDVNSAAIALMGYERERLLGRYLWEMQPEEDRLDGFGDFSALIQRGHFEGQYRIRRKDGSPIWVSARFAAAGSRLLLVYAWDITEQKQAEETLRRYELLSGHSRDIILFMTTEGRILEANAAATQAYGYSREELLGLKIQDLREPGTTGVTTAQLAEAEERGVLFESVHRRRDGSTFPVEVSSRGATIGERRTLVSVVRDIGERKQAEEELTFLKHSIDVHRDAAFWLNADNRFVYANDATCRSLGYERKELIGKEIYPIVPSRTPQAMKKVWEQLRKKGSFVDETIYRRKDGTEFPAEVVATHVRFGGREFLCGFAQDVTDKKKLEDQLRQAQKMEAVGTLAGGVAHDFNNILTVIMGLGNVIQMKARADDRIRPLVDQIVLSCERASDLTKSLLAFSRKQHIATEPHEVNDVVANAAKLLKRLLTEDIILGVELVKDHAVAMLDVGQIDQVLMNLATNARDAMPNGGSLTIRTDVARLDEKFKRAHGFGKPGMYAHLSVADSGVGMDEKTITRIFDPFFTTKEVGRGTGLGLASAYGIVKQHGGYIAVSSEPLVGTTFDIYLPLVDRAVQRAPAASPALARGTETVLVLEDDRDVRTMITRILSDQGYATMSAANGDDAISVFDKHRDGIDLVILDVVMPGKNGREVFDEIVRIRPEIRAIFMSGYTGDIIIDKGVEKESVDFLQKPISVATMLTKVREVLDRSGQRRSIRRI